MTLRGLTQPKWFWMPPEALWVTAVRAEVLPQPPAPNLCRDVQAGPGHAVAASVPVSTASGEPRALHWCGETQTGALESTSGLPSRGSHR